MKKRAYTLEEALERYTVRRTNGCLDWQGAKNKAGYGVRGKKTRLVHRLVWESVNGPIPHKMLVCHRCDNPSCCEESHLFLGTHQDNSDDKYTKGRGNIGERASKSKLGADDVKAIRMLYETETISQSALAKFFGVHPSSISLIVNRINWSHMP